MERVYVVVSHTCDEGFSLEGVFRTLDLARKCILKRMVEQNLIADEEIWIEKVPIVESEDDIHIGDISEKALIEDALDMGFAPIVEDIREWIEGIRKTALNMKPR